MYDSIITLEEEWKMDVLSDSKTKVPSILPIGIALLLMVGSVVYIAFRAMSNRAYDEKWKDYDECGLG